MLQLYADLFVGALWDLNQMEGQWAHGRLDAHIPFPAEVGARASVLQLDCAEHGLPMTAQKCARIMDQCDGSKPITYREAIALLKELRERLEDELHSQLFLHLDGQQAAMYQVPEKEWGEVIRRFGKVRKDVEEGIRCFALERYAASVFHVMLIAEFGVIEVAKLFGVEGDKPGWGALDRLQRVSTKAWKDKTAIEQKHSKFLDDLLPFALAIRNSWRHKLSHVDNKIEWADTDFSQNVAQDILSATRGFMEKLARDLPK